jgi:hypothetical protein
MVETAFQPKTIFGVERQVCLHATGVVQAAVIVLTSWVATSPGEFLNR